jgi:hypothetical protein
MFVLMVADDMYTDCKITCILKALLQRSFSMGTKFINRSGQRFGRLLVVEEAGRDRNKKVLWRCLCDCGTTTITPSGSLVTGNTTSCGCALKDAITKHGGSGKGSYNTWRAMMRRCYNVADKDYPRYGGRGVSVYEPWHEYLVFALEAGEPKGVETFDRIDTHGNYVPGNVRWATPTIQARNVRTPKTSKTGVTGVLFHNNRYYAVITAKKKKFYSKCVRTIEEAAAARKELERLHWGVA